MKVIFTKTGEIKQVSDGHARNYLIPKGLAVPATQDAVVQAQQLQAQKKKKQAVEQDQWKATAEQLPQLVVTIQARANEDGTLFGSLPKSAILRALSEQHSIVLEEEWIELKDPIKKTGQHTLSVQFPNGITATFTLQVTA